MNLGQNPTPRRATTGKAPAHQLAGDAGWLSLRLERICRGLQLFAKYCDQAPLGVRAEVKQYLDLAGIELAEALQALKAPVKTAAEASQPGAQPSSEETSEAEWTLHSTTAEDSSLDNSTAPNSAEQIQELKDPLLNPAPNGLDLNFDSLAEQAEVPEANDVEAILARLKISIETAEAGETSESAARKSRPTDAREMLLGFEVCKLTPSESGPEPAAPTHIEQAEADAGEQPSPAAQGMNDESNSWFPAVSAELLAEIGATEATPAEGSESSATHAQHTVESEGGSLSQPTPQGSATSAQVTTVAGSALLVESRASSNSASHSKHEQSESSSPLQSISPDNLKQILELKEELNELLANYKSPQSNSKSS